MAFATWSFFMRGGPLLIRHRYLLLNANRIEVPTAFNSLMEQVEEWIDWKEDFHRS